MITIFVERYEEKDKKDLFTCEKYQRTSNASAFFQSSASDASDVVSLL